MGSIPDMELTWNGEQKLSLARQGGHVGVEAGTQLAAIAVVNSAF